MSIQAAVLAGILRKIIDDDHTIVNKGGYLVMEALGHPDEINDRIIDLTDEEMKVLKKILSKHKGSRNE